MFSEKQSGAESGVEETPPPIFIPPLFPDVSGVELFAVVTSDGRTISGLEGQAPITVVGGEYSINGSPFVSVPGILKNGDILALRTSASALYESDVIASVTIEGKDSSFKVSTRPADSDPDIFSFTHLSNIEPGSRVTWGPEEVSGFELSLDFSSPSGLVVGRISLNGGPEFVGPLSVVSGDMVEVSGDAPNSFSTTFGGSVLFDGRTIVLSGETRPESASLDSFSFGASPLQERSVTNVTSGTIVPTGFFDPAPVTVFGTGASFSINGSSTWQTSGSIITDQSIRVRGAASSVFGSTRNIMINIGGVSGSYPIKTRIMDVIPDTFGWVSVTGLDPFTVLLSEYVKITGIDNGVEVATTGGDFRICSGNGSGCGVWRNSAGIYSINNGQWIQLRQIAQPGSNTLSRQLLRVGEVTVEWRIRSKF